MDTTKPKQGRSKRSKNMILSASIEVFAQKRPDETRIDEIKSISGINKQRIYAYFGSKDSLYRQVLLEVCAQAAENKKLIALSENDIPKMTEIIIDSFSTSTFCQKFFLFLSLNPLF